MIVNEWTIAEDALLLKLKKKKLSYLEILDFLPSHSQDAIRNRVWYLAKKSTTDFEKESKVLVLDIETSLMIFTGFRTGEQFLTDTNIVDDYFVMSWSAKWLGESEIFSDVLTPREAKGKNDKRICKSIWKVMDKADVIIGHNSDNFDLKKLNTRFIKNGLGLPRAYKTLDTLKLARKFFAFSCNRLDYLAKFLGVGEKMENDGYQLWLNCLKGEKESLEQLVTYNRQDVVITEKVYNILKEGLVRPTNPPRTTGWK